MILHRLDSRQGNVQGGITDVILARPNDLARLPSESHPTLVPMYSLHSAFGTACLYDEVSCERKTMCLHRKYGQPKTGPPIPMPGFQDSGDEWWTIFNRVEAVWWKRRVGGTFDTYHIRIVLSDCPTRAPCRQQDCLGHSSSTGVNMEVESGTHGTHDCRACESVERPRVRR